ncbi:hypothetical protein [Type-E symbiont of Plautia stali]|uniref:hypothetical protein n=1 Tax=Type-E symbiont of Plautia stali TaxID=1560357 RepID=UPI00073E6051|nr:hypothetical protein [Type-E symbiont of Plautia stali]
MNYKFIAMTGMFIFSGTVSAVTIEQYIAASPALSSRPAIVAAIKKEARAQAISDRESGIGLADFVRKAIHEKGEYYGRLAVRETAYFCQKQMLDIPRLNANECKIVTEEEARISTAENS